MCCLPPAGVRRVRLEAEAHAELRAAGVAEAAPDRPVEVEQETALRGIQEVVRVREVEDLEDRLDRLAVPELELLRDPDVPGEEGVVPADDIELPATAEVAAEGDTPAVTPVTPVDAAAETISVSTGLLDIEINTRGGTSCKFTTAGLKRATPSQA